MQQRQLAKSPTEKLAGAKRAPARVKVPFLVVAGGVSLLSFLTVGCPQPGDLDNPDDTNLYPPDPQKGSTGGTGGTGGNTAGTAGSSASTCETACFTTVMMTCTGCHGNDLKSAMLDVQAAGVSARLKDKPATHAEVTDPSGCPTGDKLIDSANPMESWFLKKINGQHGTCGLAMPVGPALSAADQECVKTFVNCVATGGT